MCCMNNELTLIQWNIGYSANIEKAFGLLRKHLKGSFVVMIEEVVPKGYEILSSLVGDEFHMDYSLNYRPPGQFDTKARKLGVAVLTSKDLKLTSVEVYERALLPERTLLVQVEYRGTPVKIAGLHSITGCSHLMAKSHQFCSWAEMLSEFNPDVVMMDANEPEVDHFSLQKMKFFERNGPGAEIFFKEMAGHGMVDSYTANYNAADFAEGEPLTVSHIIKGSGRRCRYDFILVNQDCLSVHDCKYLYEEALAATADHAMVVARVGVEK